MARNGFGIEQYLAQNLGVDFRNAPTAPDYATHGVAPSATPSAPSATTVNPMNRAAKLGGDESDGGDTEQDEIEPPTPANDDKGEEDLKRALHHSRRESRGRRT